MNYWILAFGGVVNVTVAIFTGSSGALTTGLVLTFIAASVWAEETDFLVPVDKKGKEKK